MMATVFLLTLSFAYILLGTCAQFTIAMFTSDPFLNLRWQHFPLIIIIQAIFICFFFVRYIYIFFLCFFSFLTLHRQEDFSYMNSGFRRNSFIFLYPFLLTLLLHLCSNLWYILKIVHLRKYQSIEVQHFFDFCSKDILNMNFESKKCTCIRDNHHEQYLVNMSCLKVKILIELIQLIPFIR